MSQNQAVLNYNAIITYRLEMEERVTMMSEEIHSNTLAVKDMVTEGEESTTSLREDLQKAIESTQEHLRRMAAERIPVNIIDSITF